MYLYLYLLIYSVYIHALLFASTIRKLFCYGDTSYRYKEEDQRELHVNDSPEENLYSGKCLTLSEYIAAVMKNNVKI